MISPEMVIAADKGFAGSHSEVDPIQSRAFPWCGYQKLDLIDENWFTTQQSCYPLLGDEKDRQGFAHKP
jgi:hypothetical protein